MGELTEPQLDEIEKRCNAATPGPWKSYMEGRDHWGGDHFIMTGGEDLYINPWRTEDQDFIAAARQDVPALIAEVRRLKVLLAK